MKLIFIYGAPAVGKLTVAEEIARQTGYKVFHNHLSIDCVLPVFEFGTAPFWRLIDLIRVETITEAARSEVNLIHTFCYAKDKDDPYVAKITDLVETNGGEICFVLLKCDRPEVEKRVVAESRKKHRKADNVEILKEIFDRYDFSAPVPGRESLVIDTTILPPAVAAEQIIRHYSLI